MNKICRICLEEGVLSSVFTKNYNISLQDMIDYCFNVKISKDDGLPEHICSNCIYKLGIAYHFKQTYESADIRLRQYLGLRLPNRSTDVATMTDPVVPTHATIIKRCPCKLSQKNSTSNYKRKPESEKLKRGPKPRPKQNHNCYQCDKQFRCQAQLDMHVRIHTGDKPYTCMYCPRRFTQKHNLTIHLRIHTGEKPFQCEICSKRFSAQSNLHAHLKIHNGQRDHVCSLCNKGFITSSELTRHMSKHRGVKNFKCDLCGTAYVHSRNLKLHKIKKHQVSQGNKIQTEAYNNGSNIDIIGLDVGKDVPHLPIRDVNHLIPNLIGEKTPSLQAVAEHNQPIYQYPPKPVHMNHSCTVCGEVFDYLNSLAQHYLHHHKDYDPHIASKLSLPISKYEIPEEGETEKNIGTNQGFYLFSAVK